MNEFRGPVTSASWEQQAAATESGFPAIDPAVIGKYAGQAGEKIGAMGGSSQGTGAKVLSTAGEGLKSAGVGAGIGASIGSIIPGVGTVIGGAIGAIGGAIAGVIHSLFGGGSNKVPEHKRQMLKQALNVYKIHHRPGAFHDALLYTYHPTAYERLRRQRRLPSQVEAHLLKKHVYAIHAREIERHHGVRLRRRLFHLPPDFRAVIGSGSVTGHSQDLHFAMQQAIALHASSPNEAAAGTIGAFPPPPAPPELMAAPAPSDLMAAPVPSGLMAPPEALEPMGPPETLEPEPMSTSYEPLRALPAGGEIAAETGAVQDSPVFMRSVVEVFDAGDAVFAWRPITVTFKRHPHDTRAQTLLSTFWVFVDALKDVTTGLRWPCSAAETQIVADRLFVAPRHLPQWWGPPVGEELPCLMMTTRLMCARWLNAKGTREIIAPHPYSTADLLITGCTLTDRAIDADLAQLARPAPWVADPGKIWALHRRLFDGTAEAVNYGWHFDPALTPIPMAGSMNAAIPGVSLLQSAGGAHSADHLDYSQKLLLVAPWCMVAALGQDRMVPMRTADVYQSRELAGLVTDDAQPLPSVRQPFDPNRIRAAREAFWAGQERIYDDKRRRGLDLLDVLPRGDNGSGPSRIYRPPPGSFTSQRTMGTSQGMTGASPQDPFASLQWNRRSL